MRAPTPPRTSRQSGKQPTKTAGKPARPTSGPAAKKPAAKKDATKAPAAKQPAAKKPATKPSAVKPSAAKPAAAKQAATRQPAVKASATTGRAGVSTQFGQRLAERRAAVRRLRWRWIAIAAAAVLVLAVLAWVALASPLLALRKDDIHISGTGDLVSAEEVRQVLDPAAGTPLARVDTGALSQEVEQIVAVREAQISRDWPRGLQVQITPREPVALVADGEEFAVLDGTGVVLQHVDEPVEGLPVVDVPLGEEKTEASLTAVLEVMDALPAKMLEQVASASAATSHDVQFELDSGAEVFWGTATENELKASVLQTLLQVEASSYDVSAPRAPITTGEERLE
ncbi:MAG TPA: FtsQ-type POTRA domain-containing protein [Ruania sp.]|nr:FtsQ-type POTRA domain-containing protein [Ruania sp.]